MRAHTPGPWSIDKYGNVIDPTGEMIRVQGLVLTSGAKATANARLIAAGPELLAALMVLVEEKADYMRRNKLGNPEVEGATKQARAAIAKATGSAA